jgi:hypothetical protein
MVQRVVGQALKRCSLPFAMKQSSAERPSADRAARAQDILFPNDERSQEKQAAKPMGVDAKK